jgi:hypothetical protein
VSDEPITEAELDEWSARAKSGPRVMLRMIAQFRALRDKLAKAESIVEQAAASCPWCRDALAAIREEKP